MAQQLGLDLPGKTALGREDFLVAPSNALAVSLIDTWPEWLGGKLVVTGPEGSGKTHLTHVWAALSDARIVPAASVTEANVPDLVTHPVAVEDVTDIIGDMERETALFHLHNLVLAHGKTLLLTGREGLAHWPFVLPDLKSRLQGAPSAELAAPDDSLLSAVLAKQFADRQIMPKKDVIPYLVAHMDRSFSAARDIVARLDAESLARKTPISRPLAAELLSDMTEK